MASLRDYLSALLEFILAVANQWASLSTGGVIVAAWAWWERKNKRPLPWPIARKILLVFLFLALFLAWKDQWQEARAGKDSLAKQGSAGRQLAAQVDVERQNVRNEQQNVRNREAEVTNRAAQLNNRDSQLATRDTQISGLQAHMLDYQKTIGDLQVELVKAKQPEPQRVTMLPIVTPAADPKIAPSVTNYLLLTNKSITPLHAIVFCDNAIVDAAGSLLGASIMVVGQNRRAPNAFQISIESPPWSPASPLLVTIHHEKDVGNCYFSLMN